MHSMIPKITRDGTMIDAARRAGLYVAVVPPLKEVVTVAYTYSVQEVESSSE